MHHLKTPLFEERIAQEKKQFRIMRGVLFCTTRNLPNSVRPNSHRTRDATRSKWECSHCTQARSKEKHSNLRARRVERPVWIRPKWPETGLDSFNTVPDLLKVKEMTSSTCAAALYRWVMLYPNSDNQNCAIIQSPVQITLLSFICILIFPLN